MRAWSTDIFLEETIGRGTRVRVRVRIRVMMSGVAQRGLELGRARAMQWSDCTGKGWPSDGVQGAV